MEGIRQGSVREAPPAGPFGPPPGPMDAGGQFMDGCRGEGSSSSRCACLYDFISARLSHDEFAGVRSDDPKDWPAHGRRVANDATATCDGDQPSEPPAGSTSAMSRPRNLPTS